MKSSIYPAFALCAILLLGSCAAAESIAPQTSVSAEESVLLQVSKKSNLRKLPTLKGDILTRLEKGSQVEVLSQVVTSDETWAYVRVVKNSQEGYIKQELLEPLPTPTPIPTPTPVPTPSPTPKPTSTPKPTPIPELVYEEPRTGRTLMNANLRKTADGDRLGALSKGERLTLIGEIQENGELWLHVQTRSGQSGYMLASLVEQLRPVVITPVSEASVLEQFPVLSCDPLADLKAAQPFSYTQEELAPYSTLSVGTRSRAVLSLKRRLYEMGYYTKPNENTLYTQSTADVIEKFQKDCGLPVTGEADPITQATLFDERTPHKEGSPEEIQYLSNKTDAPLWIRRAEVSSYKHYGSVQISLKNLSGGKLTRFGLTIIPYMNDGTLADMAPTFAEQIDKAYSIKDISIARNGSYTDFYTEYEKEVEKDWPDEDDWLYGSGDDGLYTYEHYFMVSEGIYFSGAQIAVNWYRSGGTNTYVDDDQLIFVTAGDGVGDSQIYTLPIEITAEEAANANWALGISSQYVLPVYQEYYHLPQGAYLKSVEADSPAAEAGLQAGDILCGIDDLTILGDATLRKARGRIQPGDYVTVTFWRDGQYYATELLRPE